MESLEFKVIIAGGGIAGLTLANMLERFGLDYVLLESHSAIAPPVGASIGMFPNGLRILDQIGCYEPIKKLFGNTVPYNVNHTRGENGDILSSVFGFFDHLERRHGYGLFFFDRQSLLEILYNHVQHKDKIQLNKKVTGVELTNGGARATCADGSFFDGTIIVGADGVHSNVRKSMFTLGSKLEPGYFDPNEQDSVPCYYACSFGIAQNVPGWPKGEQSMVLGKGRSQLVVSGPDDKVYWFMFEKLPETKYGKDIPRYTPKDEEEFVKRNYNTPITKEVTFGQVYDRRLTSTLTPLHEVVYKKWFFKRVIIMGDSAHKPNPIGGQGGNGAIESCAEFMNAVLRTKDRRNGSLTGLSDGEVENILRETQSARFKRANLAIDRSHMTQSLFAQENPFLSSVLCNIVLPLAGDENTLNQMAAMLCGGTTLKNLPVVPRRHAIPFHDELPAKPISNEVHTIVRNVFMGSMGLLLLSSSKVLQLPPTDLLLATSTSSIKRFGNDPLSSFLNLAISAFATPIFADDPAPRLHLTNFLPQLVSPLLIYAVEGSRIGNQGTLLSLPSIFSIGMHPLGIGRVAPLHALVSAISDQETPTGRAVDVETAKSLIPSVTLGYIIPTVMTLWATPNVKAWQNWCVIWQFAPPLVNVLVTATTKVLQRRNPQSSESPKAKSRMERYENKDVPALKTAYAYAFGVQAVVHIATVLYGWHHPDISMWDTFFKLPNPLQAEWSFTTLASILTAFFKWDLALTVLSNVGSNLYSIWNLRRLGYVGTRTAVKAGLSVLAGQVFVGSGATWAGLWYWREDKIASLDRPGSS
ncbi:hypothetical protein ACHAO9_010450 [Fusarium lateritium]